MNPSAPRPIDPARWARCEALFHAASDLGDADRRALLDRECEGEPELRQAVERFLATDASTGALLDTPMDEIARPLFADSAAEAEPDLSPGTEVGHYRILGVLGTGGMGTVYRAKRADGAYDRQVAVKMVRSGRLRGDAERRFEQERHILGRLRHSGIATLVDGGVTPGGEAYLVMELIEGEPITEYASRKGLDVAGRLRLAIPVAEAVDYAHRNLVVHRDLKPSNILVDEQGNPKLLDFGIARLLDEDAAEGVTRTGTFVLTPDYAAPEQIRGETITTATDVYAIGVILYELLTGHRPFGKVSSSWSDLERVLDTTPRPLSQIEGLDRAARRELAGDLETIVRTAMHKDPARRYASAGALVEDLRRYLDGRPVQARPDSLGYRVSKFLRRNRTASIAAAALVAAIGLGTAGTLRQAREARIQAERGDAVGRFLFSLFEGADPDLNPGEPVTALELLEAGLARVDSLDAGAEARVDLLTTMGVLFGKLGHYDRSNTLLRRAVAEADTSLPASDPALGDALDALGTQLSLLGNLEEAEETLTRALDTRRRNGAPSVAVASTEGNLALTIRRRGRYDEAAALYLAAIARLQAEYGADSTRYASELMGLGQVYQFLDRLPDAEALFRTVRRLKESAGPEDPFLAHANHNLGVVLADQERYDEASRVHHATLAMWRRLFPRGHPEVARSMEAIARVLERQNRLAEADSVYQEAIGNWSALYGKDHTQIATIRANQANLRYFAGDYAAAAAAYREGIRIWRANDERRLLGAGLRNLGIIERERGDYAAADTLLAAALQLRRDLNGDVHTSVAEVHSAIAGLRNQQSRHAEAERHAGTALDQFRQLLEPGHRLTVAALVELGVSVAAQGRFADARTTLKPVFDELRRTRNDTDQQRARAGLWLGISLAGLGNPDSARTLIEDALPGLVASLGPTAPDRLRAERELARLRR